MPRTVAVGITDGLVHEVSWLFVRSFSVTCGGPNQVYTTEVSTFFKLKESDEPVTCMACMATSP